MFGFEKENIDFLRNATFGEMSQAISRLERLMDLDGAGKDIVVFYSGHGMPEERTKEPYLIPVDINGKTLTRIVIKDRCKLKKLAFTETVMSFKQELDNYIKYKKSHS